MKNLNDIFKIITKENIILEEINLKYKNILGIYFKVPGIQPCIGIEKSIVNNKSTYLSVLAEELGHHFTTSNNLTAECFTYSDKIQITKQEKKAKIWAANFLIDDAEFIQALYKSISTIDDMAAHFNVTKQIIEYKLLAISLDENKFNNIKTKFIFSETQYEACNI